MKLAVARKPLLKALMLAKEIAPAHSTAMIFESVLLEASAATLTVSASDNEIGVRQSIDSLVESPGALALPVRRLYSIIADLPDDTVALSALPNNRLEIRTEQCTFVLPYLNATDYPVMTTTDESDGGEFTVGALAALLDRNGIAASRNPAKGVMQGVHFLPTGTMLDVVATDGGRMARESVAEDKMMALGFTVPMKGIDVIRVALEQSEATAICRFGLSSPAVAQATIGSLTVTARLLEGEFPDFSQAVNSVAAYTRVMHVRTDIFTAGVRRAMLLGDKAVKLTFAPDAIIFSAMHDDATSAENAVAEYDGPSLTMGFNGKFLLDVLGVLDGDVTVHLGASENPISITSAAIPGYVYIAMPYRL